MIWPFSYFEKRSNNVNDPNMWITTAVSGSMSRSGMVVSTETALQISAVYACVRVIAETVASLPLMIYRRLPNGGKEPAQDYPLYPVLHDSPNDYQTSIELREMLTGHVCLRGNAYAYKEFNGKGVANLIPLNPSAMTVGTDDNGKPVYEYKHSDGKPETFPQEYIWHLKGFAKDDGAGYLGKLAARAGLVGVSMVELQKEPLGMAKAAEQYGADYFANDTTVEKVVKYPGRLAEPARVNLKNSLAAYKSEKRHGVLILEEGLEWANVGVTNRDAQLLELRRFSVEEIARMFRVPLMLIQAEAATPTYASAEQFMLSFVIHTIRPWLVRYEQSINKYLIPERDRKTYFAEHKIEGLLRGDIVSRYAAYAVGRQWGWLCPDDIREIENMNPLPDGKGKIYLQPMNMVEAGTPPPEPQPAKGGEPNVVSEAPEE